jgi:hypothetical protein
VKTFEAYPPPESHPVILLCDPSVHDLHRKYYENTDYNVTLGATGIGPQLYLAYQMTWALGFTHWFKLDDDLAPKTFVHKESYYPGLAEVISLAQSCLTLTQTTHAGFGNGSNRFWMGKGFKRTYGLIHGGANIAIVSEHPSDFIDPELVRGGDVYRTCAHRARDGAVGRVEFVGFDKSKSTVVAGQTSVTATQEEIFASRDLILAKFPTMVTCEGTRFIDNGKKEIMNWRMKKDKAFRP